MKKLLATAIAGTLLVTATGAAMARPYGYGHYDRGYHRGDAGAAVGLGLGLFALGAIIASSNRGYGPAYSDYGPAYRDYGPAYRDYGPAYYVPPPPPPPPPPVYRYGYDGYYYNR